MYSMSEIATEKAIESSEEEGQIVDDDDEPVTAGIDRKER